MAEQHGGLHPDKRYQALVDNVGNKLVTNSIAKDTPYTYEFYLLADPKTINAFALPGGQIFITHALFAQLENEDQLAGVLGHEIGHVLGKHSNERITNANFWKVPRLPTVVASSRVPDSRAFSVRILLAWFSKRTAVI